MRCRNSNMRTLIAVVALTLVRPTIGVTQTGTYINQTLTVSGSGTATLWFQVPPPEQAQTVTEVWLQFGNDGGATPLAASDLSGVAFALSNGSATLKFGIAAIVDNTTTFAQKRVQLDQTLLTTSPGLYRILITHQVDVTTAEQWSLVISGLPSGGIPNVRILAFIAQGRFTSLTPVGQCVKECRIINPIFRCWSRVYHRWIPCEPVDALVICRGNCPPRQCPDCPEAWRTPPLEGYDRTAIVFAPVDEAGMPLGPGHEKIVNVVVEGGRTTGPVTDERNGQYLQMVEFKTGTHPIARITMGSRTSADFRIGLGASTGGHPFGFRDILFAVLGAALAAISGVAVARTRGRTRSPRGAAPRG